MYYQMLHDMRYKQLQLPDKWYRYIRDTIIMKCDDYIRDKLGYHYIVPYAAENKYSVS